MKYSYTVKHNGVYYPAGADVPVGNPAPKKEEVKAEPKAQVKPSVKKK